MLSAVEDPARGAAAEAAEALKQGLAHLAQGRHRDALAAFDRVLALQPDHCEALNNRGCMQLELGRHREALASFEQALGLRPEFAEAWRNRASALSALGDLASALACLDRALGLRAAFPEARGDRVRILLLLGRRVEALQDLDDAVRSNPDSAETFRNCAGYLASAGRKEDALAVVEVILRVKETARMLNDYGDLLAKSGQTEQALAIFERVVTMEPGYLAAMYNRAAMLFEQERHEDALRALDEVLRLKPDFVEAHHQRGTVLEALGRSEEALESYECALRIRPEAGRVIWNKTLCRLKLGDMPAAWRDYEWRWQLEDLSAPRRQLVGALWTGKADLRGKSILLYAEQGLGDTIQFVRYAPLVAAKGATVVLEVQGALVPLLQSQNMPGISQIIAAGESLPGTHFHCPLLSLPMALETSLDSIPEAPYLSAPADRIGQWRERIPQTEGLRVGIAWSGNPGFRYNKSRSIALEALVPLLSLPGVQFVSLQKDVPRRDHPTLARANPVAFADRLQDFADTAAVISHLDLVITTDTSVAHLAGALGKPVWIMLHRAADWRWLANREDCPWYSSARLFRQPKTGDWGAVVNRVRNDLENLARSRWPLDGAGWKELGDRLVSERRFFAAATALARAAAGQPLEHFAHNNLGNVLCEIERYAEAEASYRRALELKPDYVDAYSNLGTVMHSTGRLKEAESLYRKALALNPSYHPAHFNLANTLRDQDRFAEAETSYRRVVELTPHESFAHNNLGNILCKVGRLGDAEACYRRALELEPDEVTALCNLGAALRDSGRLRDAEGCYRRALELQSDLDVAHCNLGNVLRDLNQHQESEKHLLRALELNPNSETAYNVLGALYRDLGRATEAESCFRRSIEINPKDPNVHNNLANAFGDLGKPKEAEASYRRALEIAPDYAPARSNMLFLHAYFGMCTGEQYAERAKAWEKAVVPETIRAAARVKAFSNAPRAGRKLRVGYVSGDFRMHAVSCFIEEIFRMHDRSRVELFAYPTNGVRDSTTERLQQMVPEWHSVAGLSAEEAERLIAGHRIDVLIDLSGHTAHNRLDIFARRAAPVQCQYLGYFASTGLSEMDYFVADPELVPAQHDNQYSEQVWRLPRVWAAYSAPAEAPDPAWQPDPSGKVWFGSFNHLSKVTEHTIELWAKLLQRVPHGNLLLKTKELDDPANRRRFVAAFGRYGIAASRLELRGRTPEWKDHMALYNRLDVALDPIGGNGGATTTCDALWMGAPVVTIEGARYGERMSHSLLCAIGRRDWSAPDEEGYLDRAAKIAASPLLIGHVRATQRDAMKRSPLLDSAGMARALEDAFEVMFDRWMERRRH